MSVPPPVAVAGPDDLDAFLALAAQVEHWFGPMVDDDGFRAVLDRNLRRGSALCVRTPDGAGVRGGLLFRIREPVCRINWLVVSAADRRGGVGRALVTQATRRLRGPGVVEVVTFSADHPAAAPSGAPMFYRHLGFTAAQEGDPDRDGPCRQWFRAAVG